MSPCPSPTPTDTATAPAGAGSSGGGSSGTTLLVIAAILFLVLLGAGAAFLALRGRGADGMQPTDDLPPLPAPPTRPSNVPPPPSSRTAPMDAPPTPPAEIPWTPPRPPGPPPEPPPPPGVDPAAELAGPPAAHGRDAGCDQLTARRASAVAMVTATLTLAGLWSGTAAARAAATLHLAPHHGIASASFAGSYQLGAPCPLAAAVAFQWDPGGPVISQVPVADHASCTTQDAALVPPQNRPDLINPGDHTVIAMVIGNPVGLLNNTTAKATYTVDASNAPPVITPAPTPTPTPTPMPTAAPLLPITATFPPHNCENELPDGPTACPSSAGSVLALGPSPAGPAALPPPSGDSGSTGAVLLGAGLLVLAVGTAAGTLAWRWIRRRQPRGTLAARVTAHAGLVHRSPVDQLLGRTPLRPSAPRRTPPPPPSAPPPDWSRGRGPFN